MLDAEGGFDVVLASQVRIGGSASRDAEVRVAARPDLAVLRDVIAVQVAPVAGVGHRGERVVALGPAASPRQHVLADAPLERGLRVAEEVVDDGDTRRDVVPPGLVRCVISAECGGEAAGGAAAALALRIEHVEADARAHGQPVDRPRVLGVETEVVVDVLVVRRRRVVHRHRVRHAVGERVLGAASTGAGVVVVLDEVARADLRVAVHTGRPLGAGLERVRAGHVGERARQNPAIRIGAGGAARRRPPDLAVRGRVRDRLVPVGRERLVGNLLDVRLVALAEALDVRRKSDLEQQPVRQRRGELGLPHVVNRVLRVADVRGADRVVAGEQFRILVLPDALEVRRQPRPRIGLTGEPDQGVPHVLMLNRRVSRLVVDALAVRVVSWIEGITNALVNRHMAKRPKVPEAIGLDWTAHVEIEVLNVVDEVPELEAACPEFVVQVVRLPA